MILDLSNHVICFDFEILINSLVSKTWILSFPKEIPFCQIGIPFYQIGISFYENGIPFYQKEIPFYPK